MTTVSCSPSLSKELGLVVLVIFSGIGREQARAKSQQDIEELHVYSLEKGEMWGRASAKGPQPLLQMGSEYEGHSRALAD